MRACDFCESNM